jgi:hypothetical protein
VKLRVEAAAHQLGGHLAHRGFDHFAFSDHITFGHGSLLLAPEI